MSEVETKNEDAAGAKGRITVLGPGRMGSALVRTIVDHGFAAALRWLAGSAVTLASLVFIYKASRFFSFDARVLGKYFPFKWIIMGHVAGGTLALLMGPFQLSKYFRSQYRLAHRVMGRVYVGATTVGAVCALVLATKTAPPVGWPYALSLHMLASVWFACGLLAWRSAVQRRFKQHEEWATRSYIATIAFVAQSLSFEIPFVARLGTFGEVAATVIWFSWTVPMFAYDCLRLSRHDSVARRRTAPPEMAAAAARRTS